MKAHLEEFGPETNGSVTIFIGVKCSGYMRHDVMPYDTGENA